MQGKSRLIAMRQQKIVELFGNTDQTLRLDGADKGNQFSVGSIVATLLSFLFTIGLVSVTDVLTG